MEEEMMYKKFFNKFVKELDKKMENGFKEYGDVSFGRCSKDLINELQAETLDIAGWGLILYVKLESMKKRLAK